MSLDSEQTINPFDLDPGDTEPSNDHLSFLKNLTRFMIGDSGDGDTDLLDNLIMTAIRKTYARAQMRLDNPIPLIATSSTSCKTTTTKTETLGSMKRHGLPHPSCGRG